jgi:hypothetical protein
VNAIVQNDYYINVLTDAAFGDLTAGLLLGMDQPHAALRERVERFKQDVRAALVAEGRRAGPTMNTARALTSLLPAQALAQAALANSWRLVLEQVFGVSTRLRGEPERARRWKTPPLEVFEMEISDVSPRAPFVVAPFELEDGAYATWFLYERTMMEGGVSREGAKAALRMFSHHAKTFRVLLDGRVQRVRCLPPVILFISLRLFGEDLESAYPEWVQRERRPAFTRASKSFHHSIRGRVFSAMGAAPHQSP